MASFRFQTATEEAHLLLQQAAHLHVWEPATRIVYLRFDLPDTETHDAVNRHIAKKTQNLRIVENGTIYDMIVDPHPHRAINHPKALIMRYVIQAATETKYPEEDKK